MGQRLAAQPPAKAPSPSPSRKAATTAVADSVLVP